MNCRFLKLASFFLLIIEHLFAQKPDINKLLKSSYADTVLPFSEGMAIFINYKGKMGAINAIGKIVVQPKYEIISNYNEGLAFFWMNLNYNGYLNSKGEEIHKSSYNSVADFQGGLSEVCLHKIGQKFAEETDEYTRKHNPFDVRRNFLDHSFKLLVPYKYDSVATYKAGKVRLVSRKGKFGFLDQKAQEVVPLILDDVDLDSAYYWSGYRRVSYGGKFGFLNTNTGEWFIRPKFNNTLPSTSTITWVNDSLGWQLISLNQRPLTEKKYAQVHWVISGELAAAKTNQGFVLIDRSGKELTSVGYDDIYAANEGISVVVRNGKYGYIDEKGNEIAVPIYEKASYFHDGRGFVFGKYAYLFIDRTGKETIDRIKPLVLIGLFLAGLIICTSLFLLVKNYGPSQHK